jgi:oryzin
MDLVYHNANNNGRLDKSVVSMSIGGGFYQPLNDAVENLINEGVPVVVAAGNANDDAGKSSPSSAPDAITVGASDINDVKASFSNYGTVVDVFAPGVDVYSAWNTGPADYATLSGTSMGGWHRKYAGIGVASLTFPPATPHVSGLVCYLRSLHGLPSPAAVYQRLVGELATQNALDLGGTPNTSNRLAYNGYA